MPRTVKLPLALSTLMWYDIGRSPDGVAWCLQTFADFEATWDAVRQMLKLVYPKDSKQRTREKLARMMTEIENPDYDTESCFEDFFPTWEKVFIDVEKRCVLERPWNSYYRYNEWLAERLFGQPYEESSSDEDDSN